MYENLVRVLDEDPKTDAAQILSCEEDTEGNPIKAFGEGFDDADVFDGKSFFRALLLHRGDSSFCTKLFRKEFFDGFSFTEGRLNEDLELLVRMSEKLQKLSVVKKPGYHIILSTQSNTRGTYRQSYYENSMDNANRMLAMTAKKYPDLKKEAVHFYLMQAMWFLLHIPVSEMNKKNELYVRVIKKVRSCRGFITKDPYLTGKFRRNLMMFAYLPPKMIKTIHGMLKRSR